MSVFEKNIYKIDARGVISQLIDLDEVENFHVDLMGSPVMDNSGNFYFMNQGEGVFDLLPYPSKRQNSILWIRPIATSAIPKTACRGYPVPMLFSGTRLIT